ncbi:MAG: metal-dependent hydrolase [Isosphaeraceae bacterium]
MGNYRQHLGFAGFLGIGYAALAYAGAGVHWLYGSVAALFATVSGLLPDLDSPSGVELKGFTGILGVLAALFVWMAMGRLRPPPVFETHLWATVLAFVLVRHGFRRFARFFSVHRGISHSFPMAGIWCALTYLYYPSSHHSVRLIMAAAVLVGFVSHLVLDEICSVDLRGARVNKAFGTALKFWAPSAWSTLGTYVLLSYLTWQVVQVWPDDPFVFQSPPAPRIPFRARARQLESVAERLGVLAVEAEGDGQVPVETPRRWATARPPQTAKPPRPAPSTTRPLLNDQEVRPARIPREGPAGTVKPSPARPVKPLRRLFHKPEGNPQPGPGAAHR